MASLPVKVVIPARMQSSRLPGKPLEDIGGKPMVVRTYERAVQAVGAAHVIVATDDAAIVRAVEAEGGTAVMTDPAHVSGTDRIAEAALSAGFDDDQCVVNLQGDEPLMPPRLIRQAADVLTGHAQADMSTLAAPIRRIDDLSRPDVVKLLISASGRALYFSRAALPFDRDNPVSPDPGRRRYLRHIGIYGYRVSTLQTLTSLPVPEIEDSEKLEQLRALYHDMTIQVGIAGMLPHHGVDTPDMLAAVRLQFARESARQPSGRTR